MNFLDKIFVSEFKIVLLLLFLNYEGKDDGLNH